MFQIRFCYDKEPDDQNDVKLLSIGCCSFGKVTGLSMNDMDRKYKEIITSFVLNTLLQRAGMSWIIETHEQLEYDMDNIIHIGLQVVPSITHIFVKNYIEQCLKNLL